MNNPNARVKAFHATFALLYAMAGPDDYTSGRDWYRAAHSRIVGLAESTGHSPEVVAAVVAVLSPMISVRANFESAENVLRGRNARYGLPTNIAKAIAIRDTGDVSIVAGPKVKAFFRALLGDESAYVHDTHMHWVLTEYTDVAPRYVTSAAIRDAEAAISTLADRASLTVAQTQAIVWSVARTLKGYTIANP
jgi:hypothetical protein